MGARQGSCDTPCRTRHGGQGWCYSYQAAPGPTPTIEYKYHGCGVNQLYSPRAQSRGVRTCALGGARGPPGAGAGAACAHRPRARSSASVAAQPAVRPPRVRVGRVVEHVPTRAAGRPAGAADRARPKAACVLVRLALLDGHRMPGARAGHRRVRLIVGRVAAGAGSLLLAKRVMHLSLIHI